MCVHRCASVRGRRPVADSAHGRLIGLLDRDVPTTTTLLLLLHSLLVVLCVGFAVHFSGSTREESSPRLAGRRLTVSSIPRPDNTNTHAHVRIRVCMHVCVSLANLRAKLPRVYYTCTDEIVHAPFVTHLSIPEYHRSTGKKSTRHVVGEIGVDEAESTKDRREIIE